MKTVYFATLLPIALLAACGQAANDRESTLQDTEIPGNIARHVELGRGFDPKTSSIKAQECVTGTIDDVSSGTASQALIEYDTDQSYTDIVRSLGGKVDLQLAFPVIQVAAGAEYADQMQSTDFASNYVINASLNRNSRVLRTNTIAVSPRMSGVPQPSDRVKECGMEFVNQIDYGASFSAILRVEFASKAEKEKIKGYIAVGYAGIKVSGELAKIDEKTKRSAKVSFKIQQSGGNPANALMAFSDNVVSCSLADLSYCNAAIMKVITYLQTQFRSDLLAADTNWKPLRYFTTSYDKINQLSYLTTQPLTAAERQMMSDTNDDMNKNYEKSRADYKRAQYLMNSRSEAYTPEQRKDLETISENARDNSRLWDMAARLCQESLTVCDANIKDIKKTKLKSYDRTLLDIEETQKRQALEYCRVQIIGGVEAGLMTQEEAETMFITGGGPVYQVPGIVSSGWLGVEPCTELYAKEVLSKK